MSTPPPDELQPFCECCAKTLAPNNRVWLEMDCRTGTFHKEGAVPSEYSQGMFPFGRTCAKKVVG